MKPPPGWTPSPARVACRRTGSRSRRCRARPASASGWRTARGSGRPRSNGSRPGRCRNAPTPVGGGVIDRRDADPWVLFAARRGDAWAPGVYRIDVTWSDAAGLHDAVVAHRAAAGAVHRARRRSWPWPGRGPGMPGTAGPRRRSRRAARRRAPQFGHPAPGPRGSRTGRPTTLPADAWCRGHGRGRDAGGVRAGPSGRRPVDRDARRVGGCDAARDGRPDHGPGDRRRPGPDPDRARPTVRRSCRASIGSASRDGQGARTYSLCVGLAGTAGG